MRLRLERGTSSAHQNALQRAAIRVRSDHTRLPVDLPDWEQTNFPQEVAEMALAHTVGDKVEAAYRRGDLCQKRHELMLEWESDCGKEPTGGTVPAAGGAARGMVLRGRAAFRV
jgi:hypothetical protein